MPPDSASRPVVDSPALPPSAGEGRVPVWDLPTRLTHWAMAVVFALLWISGDWGVLAVSIDWTLGPLRFQVFGNMAAHMLLGQTMLVLVVFRIAWGVIGSSTARFAEFVRGPRSVADYLGAVVRGKVPLFLGHNPAGAIMIVLLLTLLAAQVVTGLFANDDLFSEGPWAHLVSKATSDRLTGIHGLLSEGLLILVGLHVAAAVYYLVRGENLIRAMVVGHKRRTEVPPDAPEPRHAPLWLAAVTFLAAIAVVWALVTLP